MKIDGTKVKTLRLKMNWSQEQLSEASTLSLRTIQRVEKGSNMSLESAKLLATALGVEISALAVEAGEMKDLETETIQTPLDAIKTGFLRYSDFKGKSSRYEYWWFFLFMILVMAIATVIHEKANTIVTLIFLVPFVALETRRFNDIGRSPWWQLFMLAPFGQIIVLYMAAQKGVEQR